MRIIVRDKLQRAEPLPEEGPWILAEDTWNDFSYRTLYNVYRVKDGELIAFGGIKIMRLGQKEYELPLAHGELSTLPADCFSLGTDLEFFADLYGKAGNAEAKAFLRNLREIAFDPSLRAFVKDEEVFRISLLRNWPNVEQFYEEVASVLETGGLPAADETWTLTYRAADGSEPLEFPFGQYPSDSTYFRVQTNGSSFTSTRGPHRVQPSRRVVVLIGANGVGKTELLARLARLAYTPVAERKPGADGSIENAPAFPSVVAVSYSAFDTFKPPALIGDDPVELARQLEDGSGRYVYCGMRDLSSSFLRPDDPERLLNLKQLAARFVERLRRIQELKRTEEFAEAMAPVLDEIAFRHGSTPIVGGEGVDNLARIQAFLGDDPERTVANLSSGHQIVLHLLVNLTASLKKHGLALIDEPETHLHPPLLAALMTGVRRLLERMEAYAIIATHSPVVAQETLASQVIVLEGLGVTRPPAIQTFGENVGALTRELFGLYPEATDYRRVLRDMAVHYETYDRVERAMGEPISGQASGYLASVLPEND